MMGTAGLRLYNLFPDLTLDSAKRLMPAVVMYGKPVAEQIEKRLKSAIPAFKQAHKVTPCLGIVQVGNNPESQRYVRKKREDCERMGMSAELHLFGDDISADDLREQVYRLNRNPNVHGVLVQLPLPRHIEEPDDPGATDKFNIFDVIDPEKDVDGVGCGTFPALYRGQQYRLLFLPCTAVAVRRILAFYGIETYGKNALVLGRNDITAKPVLLMLGGRMCNASAIWLHRHTPKERHDQLMRQADIVVSCVGSPKYTIGEEIVKPGAVLIDVGTRVDAEGKIHGDVDFEGVRQVASHVTPVPGGVGPVTVAALLENLFRAAQFAVGVGRPGYEF
jgi:methylenetetrahydrofolate dehydrogenase (NADP+)/methenyltetrahydrofolate cyclohydrolase